jgi:carboxypeptidase C (cathepsin A)
VQPWNFGPAGNGYLYVADDLRDAILKNPRMHVLVCSGWLDLATPFAASDYTMDHLGLAPELRKNIEQRYYRAGHMIYHVAPARQKLHEDIARFIADSIRAATTRPSSPSPSGRGQG